MILHCLSHYVTLVVLAIVGLAGGIGPPAFGQMRFDVPASECPCRVQPFIIPGECSAKWLCMRFDSAPEVVVPGQPRELLGTSVECNFCDLCCNPSAPDSTCLANLQACDSRSFSFAIDPAIEYGIPGLKASLAAHFGWASETSRCWSVQGGCTSCPRCTRTLYQMVLQVIRDETVRIQSTYQWRIEVTCPAHTSVSFDPPCPQKRESTLTSTRWANMSVRGQVLSPCPGHADHGSR